MAFCTNCGTQLTGTEAVCPACGTAIPQAGTSFGGPIPQAPQPGASYGGAAPQMQQPTYPPSVPPAQPEKKSKKGLVIGLSVFGVLLVTGIVFLVLFLVGVFDNSPVGNYRLTSISMNGETKDDAVLSAEERSMYLALEKEGKGYIVERNSGSDDGTSVSWTDTTVTFAGLDMQLTRDGDSLTLQENGGENRTMVFARTEESIPTNPGGGSGEWSPVVTIPEPSTFAGSWIIVGMEASGMTVGKEMLSSLGMDDWTVDITEDAMVTLTIMGETESIQGSIDGDVLTISENGETMRMVIEDGNLVWDMGEEGKIIFEHQ